LVHGGADELLEECRSVRESKTTLDVMCNKERRVVFSEYRLDTVYAMLRIPEFSDTQSGVFVHVSVGSKAA